MERVRFAVSTNDEKDNSILFITFVKDEKDKLEDAKMYVEEIKERFVK